MPGCSGSKQELRFRDANGSGGPPAAAGQGRGLPGQLCNWLLIKQHDTSMQRLPPSSNSRNILLGSPAQQQFPSLKLG